MSKRICIFVALVALVGVVIWLAVSHPVVAAIGFCVGVVACVMWNIAGEIEKWV